ncbi:orotidine-5'-phosphate decarboxylase [Subtercola endophyticus]|uniref:orotidine-5'-phosphate decarboxylase n=1 Tax=Subtercola endophyticus TaxID=2895559 RepID=UPI001E54C835|nr:orotidine-5'-phosphate decarboxylase [Subtercola endophyticus]UFS60295.1 orotidine-5'-phosphate decarboxylase [Subtercola endophyticus]
MTSTEDGEGAPLTVPGAIDFAKVPPKSEGSGTFREVDSVAGGGGARGFGARLEEVFARYGQLCVGIDPHDYLLDAWGLPRSAEGVREFGLRVVDAAAGLTGIVKPQVAFFELYGAAGFAALEEVLAAARAAGLLVIADAKRGDIGSSVEAYGRAWLTPGSSLEVDAMTLTAYTGVASLTAVFDLAESTGKGAFVLSATSNPESFTLQTARSGELSTAGLVASEVCTFNRVRVSQSGDLGNIGLVLGATKNLLDYGVDRDLLATTPAPPVLAPGFGFQGATFDQVRSVFGPLASATVVAVSRSVLQSGAQGLGASIRQQAAELAEALAATAATA